jgi:hypothetical protein
MILDFEQYKQALMLYAKEVQGENYPGDAYYNQDCWESYFEDEVSPEDAVESDMSYWDD